MNLRTAAVAAMPAFMCSLSHGAIIEVQDQVHVPFPRTGAPVNSHNSFAQVVTTGQSGQLSRIDLALAFGIPSAPPLFVDIVKLMGNEPDFTPTGRLATRTIESTALPPELITGSFTASLDFTAANLRFAAGDRFAILLRSDRSAMGYVWTVNDPPNATYTGGAIYNYHPDTGGYVEGNYDAVSDFHARRGSLGLRHPGVERLWLIGDSATRRRLTDTRS